MRIAIAAILSFMVAPAIGGECLKTEYQELKEWGEERLVSEYCKDKSDYENHTAVANFQELAAKTWEKMDRQAASKSWEKWSAASTSAKICKNEMDRISLQLSQKKIPESDFQQRCPVK